jgi:hypothetical protein
MPFYSDSTKTSFSDGVAREFMPADAREVTEAERLALIAADEPPGPPPEAWEVAKARALVLLKVERTPILSVLDGLQSTASSKGLAALLAGDNATAEGFSGAAAEIEALKQALKDAPAVIPFNDYTTFEEMRLAGKAYYASLVQSASLDIKTAFREVV